MCDYPEADCISIALTSLLTQLVFFLLYNFFSCLKTTIFYYSLQVHVADTVFFIVIIPPCLINSIIIKFLYVFDCMVHRWLMLYVVSVLCACVQLPSAATPII